MSIRVGCDLFLSRLNTGPFVSQVGLVAEIRLRKGLRGLRVVCQQSLLHMLSSEDEDDAVSSDEEDEYNA